jgi:acetyl esterase/lipase
MPTLTVALLIAGGVITLYGLYFIYTFKLLTSTPIYYTIPSDAAVQVCADNVYRSTPTQTHLFDLYLPSNSPANQKYPAVIFVSGDMPPWLGKNIKKWKTYTSYGRLLASSGFVAVTFNRTMSYDLKSIHASYSDIKALHAHLVNNADEYRIDIHRIAFWFLSGGGCYAGAILREINMMAMVCYYTLLDPRRYMFMNATKAAALDLDQYAIVEYVKNGGRLPPTYIAKAGKDLPSVILSIDEFCAEAQKQGASVVLREHREGRHGFDALKRDETTMKIIGETLGFLKEHLE